MLRTRHRVTVYEQRCDKLIIETRISLAAHTPTFVLFPYSVCDQINIRQEVYGYPYPLTAINVFHPPAKCICTVWCTLAIWAAKKSTATTHCIKILYSAGSAVTFYRYTWRGDGVFSG